MFDKKELSEIEHKMEAWENGPLQQGLQRFPESVSGPPRQIPVKRLYTPLDVAGGKYLEDLGFPGEYPYTRGVHGSMYRGRLWSMRLASGFGTPEQTNGRFKFLLQQGEKGLSMLFDLPTQHGYDPDHPLATGEVGGVGMSCPSLKEMEIAMDGIGQDKVTVIIDINQLSIVHWSMYVALAEKKGIKPELLGGTLYADPLEEYISRQTWIFPPKPAMRLQVDTLEYLARNLPSVNYMVAPYIVREGGATIVQEIGFGLSSAFALIDAALERGLTVDECAPRVSFNFAIHMNFFEEIARLRAVRRLWARTLKEKYGAKDPASLRFRVGPGTGGSTLTAQQAENNIARVTIEALAAVLGGCQHLHTSSYDEAYAIPTERAATIALRTQQIIAYESGVADVIDPLAGSYYVESLTDRIEEEAQDYLKKIEAQGGMIRAVETGWAQQEVARAAYQYQKQIETGERKIIGVNAFKSDEKPVFQLHRRDPAVAREMSKRIEKLRQERDNHAVQKALSAIKEAAGTQTNLMPLVIDAVKAYATVGELRATFSDVFGKYRAPDM